MTSVLCLGALTMVSWIAISVPGTGPVGPMGALGGPRAAAQAATSALGVSVTAPGRRVLSGVLDWGDPDLVSVGNAYYLYSSQPLPWVDVTVEVGRQGGRWGRVADALPVLPPWVEAGSTWAPEVHRFGGRWVLYFSARIQVVEPPTHCIGVAVASTPAGPFTPATAPLVCQRDHGGSIDPRVYLGPTGDPYLVWKSDNNSDGSVYGPPEIWSQRLAADGLGLRGRPSVIFGPDRPWQHGMVEAPDLVRAGGRLWLLYSAGGGFTSASYAIGAARCAGPSGPCTDAGNGPILSSNAQGEGPGEASVFAQDGRYWLLYNPSRSVQGTTPRPVEIAPLTFGPHGPVVTASVPGHN